MRPVEKLSPGESIVLANQTTHIIQEDYKPYRSSKRPLKENIGEFCSYCEKAYINDQRSMHVEHVQPKEFKNPDGTLKYGHLLTKWTNFLLACNTCNGTDNKGEKDVILGEVHLPHLNNTFLSLKYDAGGVVMVNPSLTGEARDHALHLLQLVGLDKTPKTSKPTDERWKDRKEAWDIAQDELCNYRNGENTIDRIVNYIKRTGHWSIWFTVFAGEDAVRKRLIEDFPGTCASCFDAANHYEPIPRNPGKADPV